MSIEELRMLERLLAVLFGGLSLYLGYRLFIMGVTVAQSGDIEFTSKMKLRAKAFAPGIFFAAFGALIIATSLVTRIKTENARPTLSAHSDPADAGSIPTSFSGVMGHTPTPAEARELIRAANALLQSRADLYFAEGKVLSFQLQDAKDALLLLAFPDRAAAVSAFTNNQRSTLSPTDLRELSRVYDAR